MGRYFWDAVQALIVAMFMLNIFRMNIGSLIDQNPWMYVFIFGLTGFLVARVIYETVTFPEHVLAEWIRTEIYMFVLWVLCEYDPLRVNCSNSSLDVFLQKCLLPREKGVAITFGVVFALTLFGGFTCRYAIPFFLYRLCPQCSLKYWFRVRKSSAQPQARYSYLPGGLLSWRTEFGYEGQTDEQGRPHGHGMWYDNSFHGECLRGRWIHGQPSGAFASCEYGTLAQFSQAPIGYITSRADCPPENVNKISWLAQRGNALRYGVMQVEVSTAGGFYQSLPSAELHTQHVSIESMLTELEDRGAADMNFSINYVDGQLKYCSEEEVRLKVVSEADLMNFAEESSSVRLLESIHSAHSADEDKVNQVNVQIQFQESGHVGYVTAARLGPARVLLERKREAFVFIHGFSSSISHAAKRMAQLLASGHMTSSIIPFIFSYSSGSALTYHHAKWSMKDYGDDLANFLWELGTHFRDVHILCHSCGAEFFLVNFDSIAKCFLPARLQPSHGLRPERTELGGRMHLATLTMMNPDVPADYASAVLPRVLSVAEHFTTYNDANDGALLWSSRLLKIISQKFQSSVARAICRRSVSADRPDDTHRGMVFGRMIRPMWIERSTDIEAQQEYIFRSSDFGDDCDRSNNIDGQARGIVPRTGVGGIDVIDCSALEQNIHKLRHNYYMLNTQMVEDICELVGERIPASRRSRLVRRQRNVFSFLCPPKHIKTF
jgi:esterase/lipase superfamily enzyme